VLLACCDCTSFKSITCNTGFKLLEQLAPHISFMAPGVSDPAIVVVLFLFRFAEKMRIEKRKPQKMGSNQTQSESGRLQESVKP